MITQAGESVTPRLCDTEREKVHAPARGSQETAEGLPAPSMLGSR